MSEDHAIYEYVVLVEISGADHSLRSETVTLGRPPQEEIVNIRDTAVGTFAALFPDLVRQAVHVSVRARLT